MEHCLFRARCGGLLVEGSLLKVDRGELFVKELFVTGRSWRMRLEGGFVEGLLLRKFSLRLLVDDP